MNMPVADAAARSFDQHRLCVQSWIRKKLAVGPYACDPQLPVYLVTTALAMLAERFPRKLESEELQKVSANYSSATPEKISERTMTDAGVRTAVSLGGNLMSMAIDNSPGSYVTDVTEADAPLLANKELMDKALAQLAAVQVSLREAGMSEFGIRAFIGANGVLRTQGGGEDVPLLQHLRLTAEMTSVLLDRG